MFDTLSFPLPGHSQLNRLLLKHNSDCQSTEMHVIGYLGTEANRKKHPPEKLRDFV